MPLSINLHERTALVTGATGQLGRTIARTLAACGAKVALQYHANREFADQLVAGIAAEGGQAMAAPADVADEASVNALRDHVAREFGPPDIVCTSAIRQYVKRPLLEQPLADFESQFRTCVMQQVLVARAFVPAMIERRHGRIIAINTEAAMTAHPGQSAYVAGKRGMDGLLRVLAREVGTHQITVNQVAPGWMISDRDRVAGTERIEHYEARVPMARRGDDRDVANAVAFLASDLAQFITGVYLPVCGGAVMPGI